VRTLRLLLALALLSGPTVGHATGTATAGDVVTGVLPVTAYAIAYFKEDGVEGQAEFLRNTAAEVIVNSAARLLFNQTSLGRRPDGTGYGFPSGHVGFVVSSAAFLEERYGWEYGLPAYALSGFVAYSRIEAGAHHRRDVIAAGALSYGIAKLFVTPENATHLAPLVGPHFLGLRWERSW